MDLGSYFEPDVNKSSSVKREEKRKGRVQEIYDGSLYSSPATFLMKWEGKDTFFLKELEIGDFEYDFEHDIDIKLSDKSVDERNF